MVWLGGLLVLVIAPLLWSAGVVHGGAVRHWSQARWDSAGLAPDPATTPEPVVQVYAARAWGWKGILAVHSWIVMKRAGAPAYERYEVVGWGVGRGAPGDLQGHAGGRRLLGRKPAPGPRRAPRTRGGGLDRSDRGGDRTLPLS